MLYHGGAGKRKKKLKPLKLLLTSQRLSRVEGLMAVRRNCKRMLEGQ